MMPKMMELQKNALSITHQARAPPSGGSHDGVSLIFKSAIIFVLPFFILVKLMSPLEQFFTLVLISLLLGWFGVPVTAAMMHPFGMPFCCDSNCGSAIVWWSTLCSLTFNLAKKFKIRVRYRISNWLIFNTMSWPNVCRRIYFLNRLCRCAHSVQSNLMQSTLNCLL